jgi:hypothetical protein
MRWRPKTVIDLLDPPEYVWPKRGNRLLQPAADSDRAVTLSPRAFDRHVHIWSGYMLAGDALVDRATQEPLDGHFLVYPILFNYRHALEVAIKYTIEQYGCYVDVFLDEKDINHNLWKLWRLCKRVTLQLGGGDEEDETLQAVQQIVKDFHDIDSNGEAFRYPRSRDGAIIELPTTAIDLLNVQRVMEGIDNFFEGNDALLSSLAANYPEPDW